MEIANTEFLRLIFLKETTLSFTLFLFFRIYNLWQEKKTSKSYSVFLTLLLHK